ncbi:MAG: FmdB family zinc ribbon protein [Burkholderiales bacterium]
MPIYAYRCDTCGHAKDVLQKMSDPVLTTCPACGAPSFQKQVTAAGFQLKGSGWYVTDFRGGSAGAPAEKSADSGEAKPAAAASETKSTEAASASATSAAPAAATGSTPAAPSPAASAPASPPKAA